MSYSVQQEKVYVRLFRTTNDSSFCESWWATRRSRPTSENAVDAKFAENPFYELG
jgi:hypothetical protein